MRKDHIYATNIPISDVWFNTLEHLACCSIQTYESSVVELTQSQKLENFPGLGVYLVDTTNTNDKSEFCLGFGIEVTRILSGPLCADECELT